MKNSYFNNKHYMKQIPKDDKQVEKIGLDSNFNGLMIHDNFSYL